MADSLQINDVFNHSREASTELEAWILSDNILPAQTEARIRGLLAEGDKGVGLLDHEIAQLRTRVNELVKQRDMDVASLDTLRAAIAPVKTLPLEILGIIFENSCDSITYLPPYPPFQPWIFGHVCSRWRKAMWYTSKIWANIQFRYPRPITPRFSVCSRARAARHPPSKFNRSFNIRSIMEHVLSHTNTLVSVSAFEEDADTIIALLPSFGHRFRNIQLHEVNDEALNSLLALSPGSFDSLETLVLSLDIPQTINSSYSIYQTTCFQSTPSLRKIFLSTIEGGVCAFIPHFFLLPWAQLTDLKIENMEIPPSIIHSSLQQCTLLVNCTLVIGAPLPNAPIIDKIILPTLQELNLEFSKQVDWDHFLLPFVVPSLTHFATRDMSDDPRPWSPDEAVALIHRSNCMLKTVKITHIHDEKIPLTNANLEPFFRVLPCLVSLSANFIIPPSIFRGIQTDGILPKIAIFYGRLRPEGVQALFDLFSTYSDYQHKHKDRLTGTINMAHFTCENGPGLEEALQYFDSSREILKRANIDIEFYRET